MLKGMNSLTNKKNIGEDSLKKQISAVVSTHTGAKSTTATIPNDSTSPQNTEGTEITELATAITPKNASSKIKVTVHIPYVDASGNRIFTGALFKDSAADALTVGTASMSAAENPATFTLVYYENATDTTERTYKFRYGSHAAGTVYVGRSSTGDTLGGVQYSMTVEEIAQ